MNIRNYVGRGLTTLALAGSLFFNGCSDPELPSNPSNQNLEQRISQEISEPNGKPDKYGVIISGHTGSRHKENVSLAYQILLESDFQRENIYILDYKGDKTAFYPVDDNASKRNIENLFCHLEGKIDSQDLLFVYFTDHGGRITKTENINGKDTSIELSYLSIPGDNLLETEMADYLSQIYPKAGILFFDQCYSGGFAERVGKENYIGISASEADKSSRSNTFPQSFFTSYRDDESDTNNDGKVSTMEAFNYAVKKDVFSQNNEQKPQIFSEIDPDKIFLK